MTFYRFVFLVLLLYSPCLQGQEINFEPEANIPVEGMEGLLPNAWAGGMDAPQFSHIDLDLDGIDDLVYFDRTSGTLSCFIRQNGRWMYAPEYTLDFPAGLSNWLLFRDFDQDGKSDLFTSSSLGMIVYKNVSSEDALKFRIYHDRSPGPSPLLTVGFSGPLNLQMNGSDIPSLGDIDKDGDMDILVFRFTDSNTIEWHKNMSIENGHGLDTMEFVRETQAYNNFRECNCGSYTYDGSACPPANGKTEHVAGKTLLSLDWEGDGDQDLFLSEETCTELYLQESGGIQFTGLLPQMLGDGLAFPAVFRIDVDQNGVLDLVAAPNVSSYQGHEVDFSNISRVILNKGTNVSPSFSESFEPFLQQTMIDVGSAAAPAFFDINGDGDLDLIIGSHHTGNASLYYFENIGSASDPSYRLLDTDFASFSGQEFDFVQPQFADITGDGIAELICLGGTDTNGTGLYFVEKNVAGEEPWNGEKILVFDDVFEGDSFSLYDVDGDGRKDLVIGRADGEAQLYHGTLTNGEVSYNLQSTDFMGITSNILRRRARLLFADITADGKADVIYSYGNGQVEWASDPLSGEVVFEKLFPEDFLFGPGVQLTFANVFGENRPALFAGTSRGGVQVYRPAGSIPQPMQEFSVYPNPVTSDHSSYVLIRSDRELTIDLVNMLGQEVRKNMRLEPGVPLRLPVDRLANGLFIVVGRQGRQVVFSRRLMIDR